MKEKCSALHGIGISIITNTRREIRYLWPFSTDREERMCVGRDGTGRERVDNGQWIGHLEDESEGTSSRYSAER